MAKAKLGSGGRFKALTNKLKGEEGVTDPAALAASIGRKKYGKNKMVKLANKGKKKNRLLSNTKGKGRVQASKKMKKLMGF